MHPEDKFTLSVTAVVAAATCTLIIGGMLAYNQRLAVMVEAGYEETTLIGYNGTTWVKSK